jgi:threonine dehydratase
MRCVPASPGARRDPPDLESLEGVRHLASRFPSARVREVSIVRADDLEPGADPTGRTRVWLALEALQVTGSVKVRGALVAVYAQKAHGRVVAASAGSHGAAVAYAAAVLGVDATVVLPRGVPRAKVDAIQRYGAEVVVGTTGRYDDLERIARKIADVTGAAFIPADDDVHIALGNGASLGFEIVRALGGVPDRVLVPSGRNGLATGMSWSFSADDSHTASRVWCTQCEQSGASGERGALATGWAAGVVVVPRAYISVAMAHAYRQVGILLEEHAAAVLAPVLAGLPEPLCGGDLVVVLAGRDKNPQRAEGLIGSPVDGGAI